MSSIGLSTLGWLLTVGPSWGRSDSGLVFKVATCPCSMRLQMPKVVTAPKLSNLCILPA